MGARICDSIVRGLEASLRDGTAGDHVSDCNSSAGVMSDSESESSSSGSFDVAVEVPGFLKRTSGGVDLAFEERRHKSAKLNEKLGDLRAVLPDVATRSKERTTIVLDAYHYIASLQRQVEDLNAELVNDASNSAQTRLDELYCEAQRSVSCHSALCREPVVDVAKRNGLLEIRIVCANRPGILVDIMEAVESRGLAIMQNRIACHNEIVIEYLSLENEEADFVEGEEERMKTMLLHAICQGRFDSNLQ